MLAAAMTAVGTEAFASEAQRRMNELDFSGLDLFGYYIKLWRNAYWEYPWVVRFSYALLLLMLLAVVVLLVTLIVRIVRNYRHDRFDRKIRKAYADDLYKVCTNERDMTSEEISAYIGYDNKKWHGWRMEAVAKFFVETRTACGEQCNFKNLNTAARLFGLTTYLENGLAFGIGKNKVQLLQQVQYLHIPIPESILVRLLENKNRELRKSVRNYYLGVSDDDPLRFIESDVDHDFRPWDALELHEQLRRRHEAKKSIPSLKPYIQSLTDVGLKATLIREVAWWGTDDDVEAMTAYFTDETAEIREAAFDCVATRHYKKAEPQLRAVYDEQTERLRRVIIRALATLGSGASADFMATAYQKTASRRTKVCILESLWNYGAAGRATFYQLRARASQEDALFFEQVEAAGLNHYNAAPEQPAATA